MKEISSIISLFDHTFFHYSLCCSHESTLRISKPFWILRTTHREQYHIVSICEHVDSDELSSRTVNSQNSIHLRGILSKATRDSFTLRWTPSLTRSLRSLRSLRSQSKRKSLQRESHLPSSFEERDVKRVSIISELKNSIELGERVRKTPLLHEMDIEVAI